MDRNVKENLFEFRAYLLAVILVLFASPLVVFQAITVHEVLLSGQVIKIATAMVFILLIIAACRPTTWGILAAQLSLIFFAYNFFVIFALSSSSVGTPNAIGAFFYNYSLLLFVLPYYWLSNSASKRFQSNKNWLGMLAVFFLFADIYGLIEFQLNDYLLPSGAQELLQDGDYVKFDHIDEFIRVSSIFKSPLEFGFFNVLISGFVLSALLSKKRGLFFWCLFLVSSASVFVTLSRTAMAMYFFNLLCIFAFYIWANKERLGRLFLSMRTVGSGLLLLILITVGVLFVDSGQYIETSTNPTNFQIRLENWTELLNNLSADPVAIWVGLGVVQNGAYGEYHEVIIDNLYLGALMTGGVFGLFLFISLCGLTIIDAWRKVNKLSIAAKFMGFSLLSFFLAFAVGGLTENLMHIMFYPFIALLLIRWMPQDSAKKEAQHPMQRLEASIERSLA